MTMERMNILRSVVFCVMAALMSACATNDWPKNGALDLPDGATAGSDPVITEHRKSSQEWRSQQVPPHLVPGILEDLAMPAKFADAVYRRDFANDVGGRIDYACAYASAMHGFGSDTPALPAGWFRVRTLHLTQWRVNLDGDRFLCSSAKGLAFELYARADRDNQPAELVLAFRGTENDRAQFLPDWRDNLSQLDFGRNDNTSYRGAREAARAITDGFRNILPGVKPTEACTKQHPGERQLPITFVGHSLGGGLAQHAAYAISACDATRAITFNTSPVTGWFFLDRNKEVRNPDPIIVRAYNDREVLSYLRSLTTLVNEPREHRVDVQIAFRRFTSERHSMEFLSYWIDRQARMLRSKVAADTGY
jgi:hypothetical protein